MAVSLDGRRERFHAGWSWRQTSSVQSSWPRAWVIQATREAAKELKGNPKPREGACPSKGGQPTARAKSAAIVESETKTNNKIKRIESTPTKARGDLHRYTRT